MFSTWNQTKMAKDANDLAEVKSRLDARRTDIRFQLQQDIIVFPVSLWTGLYVWDKIVGKKYPDLVWGVLPIDQYALMSGLPYVVLGYLFALSIRNMFNK